MLRFQSSLRAVKLRAKTTKLLSLGIRSEQWCCVSPACWARTTSGMRQRRTWTPSGRRYSEFSVYVMALLQGVTFSYRSIGTASGMISCLRHNILRRRARVVCLSCRRVYALKFEGVIDTRLADRSPPPHHVRSVLPVTQTRQRWECSTIKHRSCSIDIFRPWYDNTHLVL